MENGMAAGANRYQVFGPILTGMTPKLLMVNLEIRH